MTPEDLDYRNDVLGAAQGLPLRETHIPEFDDPDWQPVTVRQERSYGHPDSTTQPITRFLVERGTVELLSSEQTLALFQEMHWCADRIRKLAASAHDGPGEWKQAARQTMQLISRMEAAEEELFIANRRLVVACVKPFYWIGQIWIPDFLQEGSRALANAIRKFDFPRGVPFYSYAQRSIQNRLRNFFRDHIRTGALGITPSQDMTRLRDAILLWRDQHGTDPTYDILSELTDIELNRVKRLMPLVKQWEVMPHSPLSLDAVLGDSRSSLYELVEDIHQEQASSAAERNEVWAAIATLPERMQRILKLRFIEGHTFEDVAEEFGLTRARIKQIQDEALHKVRLILRQTLGR